MIDAIFNLMTLVARAAWYGGVRRRQLRPAGSGDAGPCHADAFADLSDALANTDANTDSNAGYDARSGSTRARAASDSAAPTTRVRSMAAPPAPRRRQRGWHWHGAAGGAGTASVPVRAESRDAPPALLCASGTACARAARFTVARKRNPFRNATSNGPAHD